MVAATHAGQEAGDKQRVLVTAQHDASGFSFRRQQYRKGCTCSSKRVFQQLLQALHVCTCDTCVAAAAVKHVAAVMCCSVSTSICSSICKALHLVLALEARMRLTACASARTSRRQEMDRAAPCMLLLLVLRMENYACFAWAPNDNFLLSCQKIHIQC